MHHSRTHRSFARRLQLALVALPIVVSATGCGDDGTDTAVVPLGPPAVSIVDPVDEACIVLQGEDQVARVQIGLRNWSLRPKGFCGDVYAQCGFAVFLVDGEEITRSASLITDVPLAALPSPTGAHTIRVELRDDEELVQVDDEGLPLTAEVNVVAVMSADACPADGSGL
ncbi:MAG: hypothetical protein ACOC1F_03835 [Myxococcota bacterium]